MEFVIKRFGELSAEELYDILQCRAEVFSVEQGIAYQDLDDIDRFSVHIYCKVDGLIASYLRVIDPGVKGNFSSIGRVLTMKPFRHKGLARAIMLKAIEIALQASPEIEIEAQAYLKDFYSSIGFRPISREFILEGIPHISMVYKQEQQE